MTACAVDIGREIGGETAPPLTVARRQGAPSFVLLLTAFTTFALAIFASTYLPYRVASWTLDMVADHPSTAFLTPLFIFLAVAAFLSGFRWCAFFTLTLLEMGRHLRRPVPHIDRWPLVSVFVPAFNEGETIGPALQSLIELDYPRFEVIVVDDGSTDDTYAKAKPYEGDHGHCRIWVYRKPNGGKWSALNFAFAHSTGELCLCVDADSKLGPQSIRLMVERLADPTIHAVAGQIRVRNRGSLLTRLQAIEYVMASGILRLAQSRSGTVLVVPGPLGLYRRAVMEEVYLRWGQDGPARKPGHVYGPLEGDTFAEDFDLSLAVLSLGGRIVYEPHAVSHTRAPERPDALLSQRYRWSRGTLQVLRKYFQRGRACPALFQPRLLGWLAITYLSDIVVMPLAYLVGMSILLYSLAAGSSFLLVLVGASPVLLLSLNGAAFCIALHGDKFSLLPSLLVYDFYHGFMLNAAWLIAVIDEIRGAQMRWS